jgi:hypothetical protein
MAASTLDVVWVVADTMPRGLRAIEASDAYAFIEQPCRTA